MRTPEAPVRRGPSVRVCPFGDAVLQGVVRQHSLARPAGELGPEPCGTGQSAHLPSPVGTAAGKQPVLAIADDVIRAGTIEDSGHGRRARHGVLDPVQLALGPVERLVEQRRQADVRPGGYERRAEAGQPVDPRPGFVDTGHHARFVSTSLSFGANVTSWPHAFSAAA